MNTRTIRHSIGCAALLVLVPLSGGTDAQERRIMSPQGRSATQVGGSPFDPVRGFVNDKWIEIIYGRPLRRGRPIFSPDDYREFLNDGAPIWRAGANETTRLITEVPLDFDGTRIAPGEYTVFIDLQADPWSFVLSTWPAQVRYDESNREALYGAFEYTPDRDVLRMPMRVETLPWSVDQLSWQFIDVTEDGGGLAMMWDDRAASVAFTLAE